MSETAEAELLACAKEGDCGAFGELVRRYQRRVYSVARRIVRRHEIADDIAQEAFLRAFRRLDSFDLGRPFGPWICRIAANLAINEFRSPRSREEELADGFGEAAAVEPGPLDVVLLAETNRAVTAALDALSPEQRAVVVLRAVEELSYGEIAESLGISEGTVMSRLFRARNRLASLLRPVLAMRRGKEEVSS